MSAIDLFQAGLSAVNRISFFSALWMLFMLLWTFIGQLGRKGYVWPHQKVEMAVICTVFCLVAMWGSALVSGLIFTDFSYSEEFPVQIIAMEVLTVSGSLLIIICQKLGRQISTDKQLINNLTDAIAYRATVAGLLVSGILSVTTTFPEIMGLVGLILFALLLAISNRWINSHHPQWNS